MKRLEVIELLCVFERSLMGGDPAGEDEIAIDDVFRGIVAQLRDRNGAEFAHSICDSIHAAWAMAWLAELPAEFASMREDVEVRRADPRETAALDIGEAHELVELVKELDAMPWVGSGTLVQRVRRLLLVCQRLSARVLHLTGRS